MKLHDWFAQQYNGTASDDMRKNRWYQRIAKKNQELHKEVVFTFNSTHNNSQNKHGRILTREAVLLLP